LVKRAQDDVLDIGIHDEFRMSVANPLDFKGSQQVSRK
jgi:hypothetical protein